MFLRTDEFKEVCSNILFAVDSSELSTITETLQLEVVGTDLVIGVTNREYYAEVKMPLTSTETFRATVNAVQFLKLISLITTETIELTVDKNNIMIKGNGNYKLPLIYDNDELLRLPEINIDNVTNEFDITGDILMSILTYNTKELNKGAVKAIQKLFYIDENGCITFTTGACVNNFTLPYPIKLLFNLKLVKLFKLFKDETVHFTVGFDPMNDEIIQTKVRFESPSIKLTSILFCDESLVNSVPVNAIRGIADKTYPYNVVLNKEYLLQALNRLMLFNGTSRTDYSVICMEFSKNGVVLKDKDEENVEELSYTNSIADMNGSYKVIIDQNDIKMVVESCNEQYLNIMFGDGKALVVSRGNIKNVIPEIHIN